MKLSVIGLGKLGLCTAACFASKGYEVLAHDANPGVMSTLAAGKATISEAGIDALLEKANNRLHFAADTQKAVAGSELTFIIVPTPSLSDGRFDNGYVEAVMGQIGLALKVKNDFHTVVVVSTVMPGSCETVFKPLLERLSGKICGLDFGLVYNPEFIALGTVIRDFLNPDMVLIGASDEKSSALVRSVYEQTCDSDPVFSQMSLTNGEITKLSINCYVTMKISFANELAMLCENIPGGDVDKVSKALGADSRIGPKCLKAGLGFGGPCFPRDNIAFQAFARDVDKTVHLAPAVEAANRNVVDRLVGQVRSYLEPGAKIALLGLSYKPGTHIVEESHSIKIALALADSGFNVTIHDPMALEEASKQLGNKVEYADDPYQAAQNVSAILMMTDWPEYEELNWQTILDGAKEHPLFFDAWRGHSERLPSEFRYMAIGKNADDCTATPPVARSIPDEASAAV